MPGRVKLISLHPRDWMRSVLEPSHIVRRQTTWLLGVLSAARHSRKQLVHHAARPAATTGLQVNHLLRHPSRCRRPLAVKPVHPLHQPLHAVVAAVLLQCSQLQPLLRQCVAACGTETKLLVLEQVAACAAVAVGTPHCQHPACLLPLLLWCWQPPVWA